MFKSRLLYDKRDSETAESLHKRQAVSAGATVVGLCAEELLTD